MLDVIHFILAGVVVGFCVGVTGVGGGSLMTPILIGLFKIEPHIAIGTDLLYASISKFCGSLVHAKKLNIIWPLVIFLSIGSIPAFSIIFRPQIERFFSKYRNPNTIETTSDPNAITKNKRIYIIIMGAILGIFVTLSSVGAGAFGIMALIIMFPNMPMIRIIGSDVVHAVLLTLVAGLGHMNSGNVDFHLLMWLLVGSIPAIVVGTLLSSKMPERLIRRILGITLFALGVNFIVNPVKAKPVQTETAHVIQAKSEIKG